MKTLKHNRQRRNAFTLVELLVAMAVFSILILLMLQFFTGAQKLWVSTEQKNDLYADARVAMDLMSTLLQNTYYASGGMPFIIENNSTTNARIYFPTQTQMELPGESMTRFIGFARGQANNNNHLLGMTIFSDLDDYGNRAFSYFFPPFDAGAVTSISDARTELKNILNSRFKFPTDQSKLDAGDYGEEGNYAVLLDTVTGLRFTPSEYKSSGSGTDPVTTTPYEKIPYIIEIQLTMMDKKNFDIWDKDYKGRTNLTGEAKKRADQFRQQHEHTFTRAVFLGDRWDKSL